MSAIISTNFRLENAANFKAAVASNSVYVFIGKSDKWATTLGGTADSPAGPVDDLVDMNDAWRNMIAMKRATASNVNNVVPRIDWTTGTTYAAWDDALYNIYGLPFYVLTDENKVYKCINSPGTGSTIKPAQTNINPTAEGDGYTWKYMYSIDITYSGFLTTNYMPVKTVLSDPGASQPDTKQWAIQTGSLANKGKIYRVVVTSGGAGYSAGSPPAVTIYGDGTAATAVAVVNGSGVVTAINITASGSNYNNAYVTIAAPIGSGGGQAAARAVLSPKNGHGTDPLSELGGFYTSVAVSLRYSEPSGDFIIDNSFRQIGIIQNPYEYGNTTVATESTRNALNQLSIGASVTGLTPGDYIVGGSSGAIAWIDSYDSASGLLKYHQNDKTGYTAFQEGEVINGHTGGTATIETGGLLNPDVSRFTGTILFLENRLAINRSASQIEDVKIIIEF